MRTTLALAALAALFANTGCIPFGCGGYSGGGDTVYARGSDQLIVCENGGFSATVNGQMLEGTIVDGSASLQAFDGSGGELLFTIEPDSAGAYDPTVTIVGVGSGAWNEVDEDQVSLDHADALCQALETRAWWATN